MRRIDTPQGPVHVGDTAPGWDQWKPQKSSRRASRAITAVLALVALAVVAATLGPIIASHL